MVGIMPFTLLSVAAEEIGNTVRDATSNAPVVSIEPEERYDVRNNAQAKPDAAGYIYLTIKATGEITDDITVYYTTEDASAVADAGDYDETSGSVVLTKDSPEAKIGIRTSRSEYGIYLHKHDLRVLPNGILNAYYYSRSFNVKLTGVTGNAKLDDKGGDRVECALLAEHTLDAYEFPDQISLTPYTWYGKQVYRNCLITDPIDGGETYFKNVSVSFPSKWLSDYMDSGLDAKVYMALQNAHVDESWWNSTSFMDVRINDVQIRIKGEFHDNEEFGWGAAVLYGVYGTEGPDGKYKDYFYENYNYAQWKSFDGTMAGLWQNGNTMKSLMNNKYVICRKNQFCGEPQHAGNDPNEIFIGLSDNAVSWRNLEIELFTVGGDSRCLTGGDIAFRLEDITAPQIGTNANGSYTVYNNFDTIKSGEKPRISIRFNEPVQIMGKDVYFTGKVNGIGSGADYNTYTIRFNYVGGSGTDTLYFESDYNDEHQINSITDVKFNNAADIRDLAGEPNSFAPSSGIIFDGFNLDMRAPIISVSQADSKMAAWARSKKISLTVSNISEEATLYYEWTDSQEAPASYKNSIAIKQISVNGTKTVTIFGEGAGAKYLHLKAVSRYGQEQTRITVSNNALATPLSCLGPYNFDNAPPTVDEAKLVPNSSSSMSEKKFILSLPTDNGAGFQEIKAYYVGTDGENHLIKTYSASNFKTPSGEARDVEFVLSAADVGVGASTRRTVTVFFTLTDAVGNTDEDVARQKLIFDTNSYIEYVNVEPDLRGAEKTDVIEGEYTFIYTGDPNVPATIFGYYRLLMRVYSDKINGTPVITVSQNGVKLKEGQFGVTTTTHETDENGRRITLYMVDIHHPIAVGGYYDFQLEIYEGTLGASGTPARVSMPCRLYYGTSIGELGEQINNGTVLVNNIYQLPQSSSFYYMDKSGTIGSVSKELYNSTTLPASFSSYEKAVEYVLFNEYRDLYAVTLTAELAEALNAGNSSVQKALGEETVAREGQVWIRYKSASWDPTKTPLASDWVFYYYGTSESLDINAFSSILSKAIADVAQIIAMRGQAIDLTGAPSYSAGTGTSHVDKNGAPYLASEQIHIRDMRLSEQRLNSVFSTEIIYTADVDIYSSGVMIGGVEYILIGNVIIPEGVRIQYKRIDESGKEDEVWTDIVFTPGQRFKDVIKDAGRYKLRELGLAGSYQYNVYVDKEAPMLLVTWRDKDGVSHSQILTSSSESEFRAKTFKIVGIDGREYDKYSYVAFYNVTNLKLQGVYTMSELQGGSVDIPDGNYFMVVSDRTGNSYTITLHINASELKCEIKESENVKIKFTCDRKESQIQEFYVKRNGVLVSGKYAQELEFTASGTYEFYVRDIYGNVFGPKIYEFERVYPEVLWKYKNEAGHFVSYDEQNKTKYFTLERASDGVYTISTSSSLKFQIPSNYKFTFLGSAPKLEQNVNDGTVTIKTTQSFQLKIYYEKHPDVYTIYNCSADTTAPLIDASIQINNPVPNELSELRELIEAGTYEVGAVLTPKDISYSSTQMKTRRISNNETVLSDLIKVNITDESGLAYVYVYLNGKLISEQKSTEIALNKAGKYLIVAEDSLGNKSEFTFTNEIPESLLYVVDGMPMMLGLRDFEKFDENGNFTDSAFGSESVSFVLAEQTNVFFMISGKGAEKHFVAFDVSENGLRQAYYTVDEENNVVLKLSEKLILDASNENLTLNKEYVVYEIEELGIKIYGNLNAEGYVTLTIYALEDDELTVDARLNTEDGEFHYTRTELSGLFASLSLSTSEGTLNIGNTNELIKLNRPFGISTNSFNEQKISLVEVYHSINNDFGDYGYLFMKNIYENGRTYVDEGFYFIRLVNEYGNESTFTIHFSYKFDVSSYSELADGEKIYYSTSYDKAIYSNNKIVFEVYASGVSIRVTRNGEEYKPVISIDGGVTYVILSEAGSYTVSLSDTYQNNVERIAEINKEAISFDKDLLTGYNENALKKDEGYTNKKLSLRRELLESYMISYIAVHYGDSVEVLYDVISESITDLDESKLSECVGSLGDGEYTVVARNKYGAIWTKTVHFREAPTLTLEREIRSESSAQPYDLEKAVSIGFWSNGELIFKTDAEYYEFKINGDKTECPKTLSFTSAGQHGHSEYEISYVDEYGFSYSFKAYLVRQDVEITPDLENDAVDIDGILTTTGGVAVKFTENATCTYTWNNSPEKAYTPGQRLNRDGVYRFVVSDYAGNMSAITIKKDTTVEFSFIKVGSSSPIQSGAVVNSSKVSFEVDNGDSAYIEKVYKNGILQSDFDGTKFSEDGKWEIIVSDKLGNKSYFSFYIITKQKDSFEYTTPYEYKITELWYDSGDGTKLSYIKFVNQNDSTSSFKLDENGKYTVVMTSGITGDVSQFEFTINKNAPDVSLVGCGEGATTINDVSIKGCKVGDKIKVYRATRHGEELVEEIEITSSATKMPTINEGGEYRIVVESEAGVETELTFVRKHVMNTEGSIFIMIIIAASVVALFVGLIYRNKSKTDK